MNRNIILSRLSTYIFSPLYYQTITNFDTIKNYKQKGLTFLFSPVIIKEKGA